MCGYTSHHEFLFSTYVLSCVDLAQRKVTLLFFTSQSIKQLISRDDHEKPAKTAPILTGLYLFLLSTSPESWKGWTENEGPKWSANPGRNNFFKEMCLRKIKSTHLSWTDDLSKWRWNTYTYIYIWHVLFVNRYIYIDLEREREISWDKVTTKLHFFDLLKWTAIKAINGSEREILSRLMSWSWKPWCFFQRRYSCYIDTTYI